MKKLSLLFLALASIVILKAQWVDDPMTNTFIANCSNSAAEIYVASSLDGGTFVQWTSMSANGWSPKLQLLDIEGVPQWGPDGVIITTDNIATWSPGYAIAALNDGSVVSMFRTADARHWVVKINADGSTPWGTDGMVLFDGEGGGRSELLAGDDGGFWALGTDMDNLFLCYVNADGSFEPTVTISDPVKKCSNGVMVPARDCVFVVYSKHTLQGYTTYNKEIYLAGYTKNGEMIVPETLLFGLQSVGASYIHYVIPDGLGGGYVFQWHSGIGAYNTYVTHFDANGIPTISDPNGVPVHSIDPSNFYINAYPTIDPVTHDLRLVYRQTESASQSQYKININRITANGEKPWGDGLLVLDNGTSHLYNLRIDAFEPEYGGGFSVIDDKDVTGANAQTIEAQGFDMDGNAIWSTQMCSNPYPKTGNENTTGFHNGQNIVTWVIAQDGGVYGQNIGTDGTMGHIEPIVITCYPPENFEGEYLYDMEEENFGTLLSWGSPEIQPLHYNLYRSDIITKESIVIEIDGTETSYYDACGIGSYNYQLTAVYENCESDFALTPTGENQIIIDVTGIDENMSEEMVSIVRIYSMNGQCLKHNNTHELSSGLYILQGLTEDGRWVNRKVVINK